MQTTIQPPIIQTIINASTLLRKSKLNIDSFSQDKTIISLNHYFQTETINTIILVAIFQLSSEGKSADREDLARFFDCNPILFFKYEDNFKDLINRSYLEVPYRYRGRGLDRQVKYQVTDILYRAIVANKDIEMERPESKTDPVEILMELGDLIEERESNSLDTLQLEEIYCDFIQKHNHSPLCRAFADMEMAISEKLWFTTLAECNLRGKLDMPVEAMAHGIFSRVSQRINFSNFLQEGRSALIADKWIEFSKGGHFTEARVKLTTKSQKFLKPLGVEIRLEKVANDSMLTKPGDIIRKKLFYNPGENEQMGTIANSLAYRNHSRISKRLQEQGMPLGICTLLYGAPGTGKTESVYQMARETGRGLWKVDLTELKSMWFGESQKKVKELFERYKILCEGQKRIPILLLNEADAVLGRRQENTHTSSQNTDNAIQNIFLDCLEDFEGILFATTNLEKSLDEAFERRFLFKVEFQRPAAKAQQQIWKSKLKELTKTQGEILSEKFDLSGGEIDNVLRKLSMMRILNANVEVFKTIEELCGTEKVGIGKTISPIGFRG